MSTEAAGGVMSNEQCELCHRDLSPGVLVRCREIDCPLLASRTRASVTVLSGLLALAVIVGVVIALSSWFLRGKKPLDGAPVAPSGGIVAQTSSPRDEMGGTSILGGLPAAGQAASDQSAKPADAAGAASEDAGERPDPRAATLVQSFPCEGSLSASRLSICTHWSLATSDYNLSLQYKSALHRSKNSQALREAHSAWLARLDGLGGDLSRLRKAFDDWRNELSRL